MICVVVVLGARRWQGRRAVLAVGCGGAATTPAPTSSVPSSARPPSGPTLDAAAQRFLDTLREGRRARRRAPTRAATRSARARPTGCWSPPRSATRSASTRSGTGPRTTCAAPTGCISFLWKDGKVVDPEAASDADVDAARALLVASCRFKTARRCATRRSSSAKAIMDKRDRRRSRARRCWWPARGRARTPITSTRATSRPPRSRRSATRRATAAGAACRRAARTVTDLLMPSQGDLPPDWAQRQGRQAGRRAGRPASPSGTPLYGFDARAHARALRGGSRPGRAADRRQGVARLRGAQAGRHPGRARPVRQAGRAARSTPWRSSRPPAAAAAPPATGAPTRTKLLDAAARRSTSADARRTTAPPGSRSGASCSTTDALDCR